jgi:HSP20 family protein
LAPWGGLLLSSALRSLTLHTLSLTGKKTIDYAQNVSVHRRERVSGEFDRTLTLPVQIDPDAIKAEYRDGILAIFIPRAESEKPRTIKIR